MLPVVVPLLAFSIVWNVWAFPCWVLPVVGGDAPGIVVTDIALSFRSANSWPSKAAFAGGIRGAW